MNEPADKTMAELSFEKYQERLKTSIDSPDRDIFHHSSLFSEMAPTKNSYMDGDERESTQIYEGEYRDIYEFQTVEKIIPGFNILLNKI